MPPVSATALADGNIAWGSESAGSTDRQGEYLDTTTVRTFRNDYGGCRLAGKQTRKARRGSARLFVNFFEPSFKLIRKERDGARVHKTYSAPATHISGWLPKQEHLMPSAPASMKCMPAWIRSPYRAISEPCRRSWPVSPTPPQQAIQLRCHRSNSFCRACESRGKRERSARPTGQLRSRSVSDDALIHSSRLRHSCANGSRPSRGEPSELLCKLQAECPGAYPIKVLRTLQRRLKSWRSEQASALLFSSRENAAQTDVIDKSPESPPLLDEGTAV